MRKNIGKSLYESKKGKNLNHGKTSNLYQHNEKRRIAPPSRYHVSVNSIAPSLNLASRSLLIVRVCVTLSATLMMIPLLRNRCINALAWSAYLCGVDIGTTQNKSIPLVASPQYAICGKADSSGFNSAKSMFGLSSWIMSKSSRQV